MGTWFWERFGTAWWELDPPRHLWVHTQASLEILAGRAGLVARSTSSGTRATSRSSRASRSAAMSRGGSAGRGIGTRAGFDADTIAEYKALIAELNRDGRAGRAGFYFRRIDGAAPDSDAGRRGRRMTPVRPEPAPMADTCACPGGPRIRGRAAATTAPARRRAAHRRARAPGSRSSSRRRPGGPAYRLPPQPDRPVGGRRFDIRRASRRRSTSFEACRPAGSTGGSSASTHSTRPQRPRSRTSRIVDAADDLDVPAQLVSLTRPLAAIPVTGTQPSTTDATAAANGTAPSPISSAAGPGPEAPHAVVSSPVGPIIDPDRSARRLHRDILADGALRPRGSCLAGGDIRRCPGVLRLLHPGLRAWLLPAVGPIPCCQRSTYDAPESTIAVFNTSLLQREFHETGLRFAGVLVRAEAGTRPA